MNLRIVRVDETQYVSTPGIKHWLSYYLVDTDVETFCCEMTPSYWLWYLYDEMTPEKDLSDEELEKLYDLENAGQEEIGIYRHCDSVLRLPHALVSHQPLILGEPEPEGQEEERAVIEDCLEYYRCNRGFI